MDSRNSHIRGPYDISSFFVKKLYFSVFLLNSIANKDSRLNGGIQFHLIVPVSFPFRTQIWVTVFFSIRVFFRGHWKLTGRQGKGGDHLLFHSTTCTRSPTLRHLFATLHVRWLTYFSSHRLYLPDCYSMRFTTLSNYHLIDWWCNVDFRLLACWFDFRFFTTIWHQKPVDTNSHGLYSLYYKRTDLPSVLVTPIVSI